MSSPWEPLMIDAGVDQSLKVWSSRKVKLKQLRSDFSVINWLVSKYTYGVSGKVELKQRRGFQDRYLCAIKTNLKSFMVWSNSIKAKARNPSHHTAFRLSYTTVDAVAIDQLRISSLLEVFTGSTACFFATKLRQVQVARPTVDKMVSKNRHCQHHRRFEILPEAVTLVCDHRGSGRSIDA